MTTRPDDHRPSSAAGAANSDSANDPLIRHTEYGLLRGSDDSSASGTWSWKGIPFAQPPLGDLRWRAPRPAVPWQGVREAVQFGPAAVQYGRVYGPGSNNRYDETIATTLNEAVGSEDCLYLNIWRPDDDDGNLPVIVFIHGGSNVSGYPADPLYDGAALARSARAVVVTVGYRLGIFGWLRLPQLRDGSSAEDDSGNFAILDLIEALRFVQRNIAAFGGDAGNVTLMGQSAGAINVYALLVSPQVVAASPPLVHRAVPLSGGISMSSNLPPGSLPIVLPLMAYEAQGPTLVQHLLIAAGLASDAASAGAWLADRSAAEVAAWLRDCSPATLLTTLFTQLTPLGLSGSGPIPEGSVVPQDPIAAIAAGQYRQVPVLASTTRDEGKLFPTFLALSPLLGGVSGRLVSDAQMFSTQFHYDPDAAAVQRIEDWIPAAYLPVSTPETGFTARTELLNRLFFGASRDNVLNTLKTRQAEVWYWRFDWDEEPAPWNDIYGAAHLFDVPFVLGNFGPSLFSRVAFSRANEPGRQALSVALMQTIACFARSGDPNHEGLGQAWPAWPATLVFDADADTAQIRLAAGPG